MNNITDRQDGMGQYLPNFIKLDDDSAGYGVFIRVGAVPNQTGQNKIKLDESIHITGLGNLDETSQEKIATNFADLAKRDYNTDIFLENLYQQQNLFKRAQINAPIFDLKD